MTKTYYPFDAGAGANVTEDQWRQMARHWAQTGVLEGELNEFAVFADSSGMQVKVPSGLAWVRGHFFESDAQETLAIGAADASNPRIDRVVVRADFTANTVDLVVLEGTPAVSPAAPALTQSTSRWEVSLAQVAVAAAAATIAAGDVTDERTIVPSNAAYRALALAGCRLNATGSQSIASSTETAVQFNGETFDTNGYHDNTTNNTRITVPAGLDGYHRATGRIGYTSNSTGGRRAAIRKNGTTVIDFVQVNNAGANYTVVEVSSLANLVAGDYLELMAWQDSGGALALDSAIQFTSFAIERVGT